MIKLSLVFMVLFILEFAYIKVADYFNIIDKPNERSSHTKHTIRGGGIIFVLAWLLYFFISKFHYPYFTIGLILVSGISFLDDIKPQSAKVRILIHLISFSLCFYQLGLFSALPLWAIVLTYIFSIGCLNAINFMDGINGITGMYSMAVLIPLATLFNNASLLNPINLMLLSLLVFGFFNFRKKALCFAGDVGSVSIAFVILFFLIGSITNMDFNSVTQNLAATYPLHFKYILFLTLYGVDAVLTLVHRLYLKENIFQAHRKHLFQLLANEMEWPQLFVALLYAAIQLVISYWVLNAEVTLLQGISCLLFFSLCYILSKIYIMRTCSSSII